MSDELELRVRNLVAEQLGVDLAEVRPDAHILDDLGADSLDVVELVMALEESFDIEIPDSAVEGLRTIADVEDCLVVGVPDERFGQSVAALVVREPTSTLATDDVVGAVRASLAGYKVPRRIIFVEQVPRLPNGKVDYDASKQLVEEG